MTTLTPDNLKAAERRIYTVKFRDGLQDLQIGLILLVVFGFMLLRESWDTYWVLPSYAVVCGAIVYGVIAVKKHVTRRRIGTMKPIAARKKKLRTGAVVLAIFVAAQATLIILQMQGVLRPDFERLMVSSAAALIVFIPMAALAWFHDFTRGYLHALLVGLSTGYLIATDSGLFFLFSGLVILSVGVVVFIRFLKEYPLPEEADDVQS